MAAILNSTNWHAQILGNSTGYTSHGPPNKIRGTVDKHACQVDLQALHVTKQHFYTQHWSACANRIYRSLVYWETGFIRIHPQGLKKGILSSKFQTIPPTYFKQLG